MLRPTAILAMGLGVVVCCGCGGDSAGPAVAAGQTSGPPKPIPFKEGEAAAAAKPGAELPTQLGGPQIRNLLGGGRAAAADAGSNGNANSSTSDQSAAKADPSAPSDSKTASTPPANSTTPAPPANDPSAPTNKPPANDPSAPTTGSTPPANDPSAPRSPGRGIRRHGQAAPADASAAPKTDSSASANGENAVKADPTVGAQGKDYGNADGGYVSEPIREYFGARAVINFDQMTKAMRFFEADKGRKPKSNEEFMKEIIQAWGIQLPELPEGQKYQYDPKKGELMVIKPVKK